MKRSDSSGCDLRPLSTFFSPSSHNATAAIRRWKPADSSTPCRERVLHFPGASSARPPVITSSGGQSFREGPLELLRGPPARVITRCVDIALRACIACIRRDARAYKRVEASASAHRRIGASRSAGGDKFAARRKFIDRVPSTIRYRDYSLLAPRGGGGERGLLDAFEKTRYTALIRATQFLSVPVISKLEHHSYP